MEPTEKVLKARPIGANDIPSIEWVERIAKWMDSRFLIPGTNIKFGVDPFLSLFPVAGDLITFVISCSLIYTMQSHGASRKIVIRMLLNSTLDALIGSIPVVGTIFDIFYRANTRNVQLLKEHYYEGKHQGKGNWILILIFLILLLFVAAAFYGIYKLMEAIF